MLVSYSLSISAQSSRETIVVTELNSVLFTNGVSARVASTSSNSINIERLRDLVIEVQNSYYFTGGEVKTYGDQPTNLYTDSASLNQVNNSIPLKQNIEIVTIRINNSNEANSPIDLSVFSNFPNLKYIYFLTSVNTTSQNIASKIINYSSRFNIFYKIDKGDSNQ